MPLKVTRADVGLVDMSSVPVEKVLPGTFSVSVKTAKLPKTTNDAPRITTTRVARSFFSIPSSPFLRTGSGLSHRQARRASRASGVVSHVPNRALYKTRYVHAYPVTL